jgi:prepilin-type N-terminal cleavage/methylation domain-containing protein
MDKLDKLPRIPNRLGAGCGAPTARLVPPTRSGLTLIELLVVITVSVLLLVASVQLLRLPIQSRKTREAARQMSALVARAKARAAELNRPVGLMFRRGGLDIEGGAYFSTEIDVVETPPYYVGDLLGAQAFITGGPSVGAPNAMFPLGSVEGTARLEGSETLQRFAGTPPPVPLRIRFDNKNPWYTITALAVSGGNIEISFVDANQPRRRFPAAATPRTFQIEFQPGGVSVFPTLSNPTQLPTGVGVDLTVSGIGQNGRQFAPASSGELQPVLVMFNPEGHIDRVLSGGFVGPPLGTVFFLIGKSSQVLPSNLGDDPSFLFANPEPDGFRSNVMDAESIWVAVTHQAGKITVAENRSLFDPLDPVFDDMSEPARSLRRARTFARLSQDMGGR